MEAYSKKYRVKLDHFGSGNIEVEVDGLAIEGTGLGLHLTPSGEISVTHIKSGLRIHPAPSFRSLGEAYMFAARAAVKFPFLSREEDPKLNKEQMAQLIALYQEAA